MSLNLALCQPHRCALPPAAWSQHLLCCLSFIAGLQTTTCHGLGSLPSPPALCSVPLLANTAPPTSAVPSVVSTWSSGAPALIPVDHLPPISSFSRFPAGLPLLSPTQAGLILSPEVEPVPHKLVQRIQSGQFVEMRDLLGDNIALLQQLDSVQGALQSFSGAPKPRLREITSLSSWLHCFLAYTAIRSTDQATRDQLTYARLLIQEYLRHGGNGWLDYDRVFRQLVAINPSLPWNTLHPGLHTSTILGQRSGTGSFCTLCTGSDHTPNQCALVSLQQPTPPPQPSGAGPVRPRQSRPARRPESLQYICVSWNKGSCVYPGTLTYKHICATCQLRHRAKDCPDTPEGPPYKPAGRRPKPLFPKPGDSGGQP